jgi:hypothetical protein
VPSTVVTDDVLTLAGNLDLVRRAGETRECSQTGIS